MATPLLQDTDDRILPFRLQLSLLLELEQLPIIIAICQAIW